MASIRPVTSQNARCADPLSPLMLSHQLLTMAEDAHRAGLQHSATRLLRLAHTVCNDGPGR